MKTKIFFIIILITFILFSSNLNVFGLDNMLKDGKDFINTGETTVKTKADTIDTSNLKDVSNDIYNALLGVGISVAVIVGAILGVQFMTAGIDKKVQVKESLVAYVVSTIVLFGAFGIWKLIVTLLSGIK